MEVFSVINLANFRQYQDSFGYIAQQLNFPEKITFNQNIFQETIAPSHPAYADLVAYRTMMEQYTLSEIKAIYTDTFDFSKKAPFTATYQCIDDVKGIYAFTLQNISPQIERQEKMYQRQMIRKVIAAQENERKRISRELHDSVVQELLNINIELRLLKYQQDKVLITDKAQQVESLMANLIDDIRNISVELRPSSLDDLGLEAAFKSYFKHFEQTYGLAISYQANIQGKRYDSDIETVVYRVVQESILNALKYASVNHIDVSIQDTGNHIIAEVIDQGVGFNPQSQPKGTGLGLYGMNERAELVNGNVNIDTQIGKGTIITLEIPI